VEREHAVETVSGEEITVTAYGKVCLPRSSFLGIFLFLGILTLVQAIVVGAYITKRLANQL